MVEKVRMAVTLAEGLICPPANDHLWLNLARRAIAAMRDPTPEMIQAGEFTLTEPRDTSGYPCSCDERAVWQAMIDAAGERDD